MAKIRFPTRIAQATDDEESRYALQGTLVTPEGFAVATDGRMAACVMAKVERIEAPILVPRELGPASKSDIKAAYQTNGGLKCEKLSIIKGQSRVEQAEAPDGRFPRVGEILNRIDVSKHVVLPINTHYLWRLTQAINLPNSTDIVVLLIPKPDDTGLVTDVVGVLANAESVTEAGGFGIIMPVDAEAATVRADFMKLRDAAAVPLDAAAKGWSDMCLAHSTKEEEIQTAAERKSKKREQVTSPAKRSGEPKQRRQPARKRSVA